MRKKIFTEKLREALSAVLPIICIVLFLSFTVTPVPSGTLLAFLAGGAFLVTGMMLFTLGAETAMEPMGEKLGARITATKNLPLILFLGFALGFMITITEPDLQVLADQVAAIPGRSLIFSVAGGVGIFLVLALLRMLIGIPIRTLLIVFYGIVFAFCAFAPSDFLPVAFDAGGVTTGPMTVPFIMAFGIGISAIRSDRHAADDSFGLISLCSVGPVIAVLILSVIYRPDSSAYTSVFVPDVADTTDLGRLFLSEIPSYMKETGLALLPLCVFFAVFQLITRSTGIRSVRRILVGIAYTFAGLVIFLTGVNAGFGPVGSFLGGALASVKYPVLIIPVGMLIGYFIVKAEPAVYVLMRQVEEITDGHIAGRSLRLSLSVGVSVSVGLAMIRVLTGVPILYFIIPGYIAALVMAFFVPKIFTAIAFDSGGVASGPMTAAFLLPFSVGACSALGGNIVTDAFGVVAMVAMTPLITIQALGLIYKIKTKRKPVEAPDESGDDFVIIEL